MKMTFRWYGSAIDPIPLKYVKQIPGMTGLMGLLDKPAGVDWPEDEFKALKKEVNDAGLEIEVIESVNVHEDIKMGLPTREEYIANYISTIRMLAKHGVKVIVYNFMPVFDWLRTDLARIIPEDGSNSLYFDEKDLGEMGPLEIVRKTAEDSHGFTLALSAAGNHPQAVRKHRPRRPAAELQVFPGRGDSRLRGSGRAHGLPSRRPGLAHFRPAPHHPQPG